ncbi:MAG: hypothetical protein AB1810_01975 [Pseudomonadota bacterium]
MIPPPNDSHQMIPIDGKTDYERLKKMTEEEIEKNAKDDPDAPLQSDEDLKRFKRVTPKKEK